MFCRVPSGRLFYDTHHHPRSSLVFAWLTNQFLCVTTKPHPRYPPAFRLCCPNRRPPPPDHCTSPLVDILPRVIVLFVLQTRQPGSRNCEPAPSRTRHAPSTRSVSVTTMPRASTVSEKIWAQAIHAVTVQKMSLRRAAQLYGVHHMSLHRRVRGRYMTNQPTRFQDGFVLTAEEEEEILNVLREQFMHERHVSPDDVRYVVRTIASQDGRREIPTDFPLNRWILNFKRVHSLESPPSTPCSASGDLYSNRHVYERDAYTAPVYYGSSNGSTPRARSVYSQEHDSTSESESEHHHRATREQDEGVVGERRCQQSSLVPPEVWEKAIDAVETQGMSLRNAAKAYDVHFAALHRRVKKRAMKRAQDPLLENYIPFEDEAGIIRVIHARADLGLLMSFDELVDLINRTAMKYIHLTPDLSRSIVQRFQARVEQAIRHLITDWPLPQIDSLCRKNSDEKVSSPVASGSFRPPFPRTSGQSTPTELNNRFQSARISSEPKAMYAYPAPDQFPRPMYHNEAMPIAVDGPNTPPSTIFHL